MERLSRRCLDAAQHKLGDMINSGHHIAQDLAAGLRLCQLAAAQGYAFAMFMIAECHDAVLLQTWPKPSAGTGLGLRFR